MSKFLEQRQVIFQQMAQIDQMEHGSIKAEYRPGSDPDHPLGPYFKHQVWQAGKNRSQRVAGPRAEQLRQAVAGRQRFEQLAQECIELTVAHTRQTQTDPASKKNSRNPSGKKRPPNSKPLSP